MYNIVAPECIYFLQFITIRHRCNFKIRFICRSNILYSVLNDINSINFVYTFLRKDLDDLVEAALLYYGSKKVLDNRPLPLSLEKDNDPRLLTSPLKFPGKLEVDVLNNRLFISDSNHNRIVSVHYLPNLLVFVKGKASSSLCDSASVIVSQKASNYLIASVCFFLE